MLWALFQVVVFAPLLLDAKKTHLDIGFVWVRTTSEMGWTWRHNQGCIFMHTRLTEKYPELEVRTHYAKNVDDTVKPPNCPSIYDKWGSSGLDIVFGTSFGHQECLADMVDKYPNTVWFHISGFLQKPEARNWGLGYARIYHRGCPRKPDREDRGGVPPQVAGDAAAARRLRPRRGARQRLR